MYHILNLYIPLYNIIHLRKNMWTCDDEWNKWMDKIMCKVSCTNIQYIYTLRMLHARRKKKVKYF